MEKKAWVCPKHGVISEENDKFMIVYHRYREKCYQIVRLQVTETLNGSETIGRAETQNE